MGGWVGTSGEWGRTLHHSKDGRRKVQGCVMTTHTHIRLCTHIYALDICTLKIKNKTPQ